MGTLKLGDTGIVSGYINNLVILKTDDSSTGLSDISFIRLVKYLNELDNKLGVAMGYKYTSGLGLIRYVNINYYNNLAAEGEKIIAEGFTFAAESLFLVDTMVIQYLSNYAITPVSSIEDYNVLVNILTNSGANDFVTNGSLTPFEYIAQKLSEDLETTIWYGDLKRLPYFDKYLENKLLRVE